MDGDEEEVQGTILPGRQDECLPLSLVVMETKSYYPEERRDVGSIIKGRVDY